MANTVSMRIYTGAFPLITANSLKYVVYKESDYPAEAASQTFAPPHPIRLVTFNGLDRVNYIWKLLEMNGAAVVTEKASFNVVPDNSGIRYKEPIEIQVDVTTGLVSDTSTFTFDGTAGTEDWRGWEIFVERIGQGTMQKGVQYTWDKITGVFTLLLSGDAFQSMELFNVEFGLIVENSSSVPAQNPFTGSMIVTGTTLLDTDDVGKKIIIEGATPYFEITLPDITLLPTLIPIYFESGAGSHKCVRIKTQGGQVIVWLKPPRTDIKIGVCEHIALYREPGSANWRVHEYAGNFMSVGRIITTDADIVDEFNCVEMNGASLSITEYARLYEDVVLQLPPAQVVNFVDWATGNNKYKFSLAQAGLFKVPDRRNMFDRNSDGVILPGVYQADNAQAAPDVKGVKIIGGATTVTSVDALNPSGKEFSLIESYPIGDPLRNETTPKTVVTRKFILT